MINLAVVVSSPLLSQTFTVQRSTGKFELGGWKTTPTNIQQSGVVSVATDQDLQMITEGDRVTGAMVFHSVARIYETQLDGGAGQSPYGTGGAGVSTQFVSDQISWRGQLYRILKLAPYADYGYWRAIGVRMSGR